MKNPKKKSQLVKKRERMGYTFVIHWVIGLAVFFYIPIIQSIGYSFSSVIIGDGVETFFVGLEHYKYIFAENPDYVNNLRDAIGEMFYSLPIIIALSLILAVVLNQKFKGQVFARAIFFLPVIFGTSAIMTVLTSERVNASLFVVQSGADYAYGGLIDFKQILGELDLPSQISDLLEGLLGKVFNIIWNCGVQTILFLAGLQSIPVSQYEVSKIEGANKWEEFWFVTIPSLRHIITLVIVYTMITIFTSTNNVVMGQSFSLLQDQLVYDISSAMLWSYFVVVLMLIGTILLLYQKFAIKRWE